VISGPFRWLSPVYFDELDVNGALHNSRYAVHVERAQSALFEQLGRGWTELAQRDPDLRYVVRELHVEFLAPLRAPGALAVELTAGPIGRTSATYHFRCASPATGQVLARGHRVIVKIDEAGRPSPWSGWYRELFATLPAGPQPAGEEGAAADDADRRPAAG
jgi:acyl-CoA thioester hydrolase